MKIYNQTKISINDYVVVDINDIAMIETTGMMLSIILKSGYNKSFTIGIDIKKDIATDILERWQRL